MVKCNELRLWGGFDGFVIEFEGRLLLQERSDVAELSAKSRADADKLKPRHEI